MINTPGIRPEASFEISKVTINNFLERKDAYFRAAKLMTSE
jgi:hypothetical protein